VFGWLTGKGGGKVHSTRCAVCDRMAAEARLSKADGGWRLVYFGIVWGTGAKGAAVSDARAQAVRKAFKPPWRAEAFNGAGLHDLAGICTQCAKPYCWVHWGQPVGGEGRCPQGHFQDLDPHFDADWGDDA
jgi:hypothetical protein